MPLQDYIFLDEKAVTYAKQVIPSQRGELEITSLLNIYLKKNTLNLNIMNRGFSWFDVGTHESFRCSKFCKAYAKKAKLNYRLPRGDSF